MESGICFQSPSVLLCPTYTVMGEEITAVVCLSSGARGRHVNASAPAEVTPETETTKNEWAEKQFRDEGHD